MTKKHKEEEIKTQDAAPVQEEQQQEQEDYLAQLVRLKADFENYRKRTEREKPLFINYGREEVIKKFLPLFDALLKAQDEANKKEADLNQIKQGLNMIFEEFKKVFKSEGVEILSCQGQDYNPMEHEAITTMPCGPDEDNKIIQQVAQGIKIDGKVVKPAQVIVGKCQQTQEENNLQGEQ